MFKLIKKLKAAGILSLNSRNADYILPHNARKFYPIVDDKLQTKQLAVKHQVAVPPLYAVVETEHHVSHIHNTLEKYNDFVIKPAHGAGGDGILVITQKVQGRYRKANGLLISEDELAYHLSCILSGAYSLGGHPDVALIEHRVDADDVFAAISYQGVPDIRVIVFLGYPVMAMARLPTRQSEGKANLHQGAIGVGIDLRQGLTQGGVVQNQTCDFHPDTLHPIAGIQVPFWQKILTIAASCYEMTGLGYLGVDIVLDKEKGPLLLELNARPGLNIQIANRIGLKRRYQIIEERIAYQTSAQSVEQRILFSQQSF